MEGSLLAETWFKNMKLTLCKTLVYEYTTTKFCLKELGLGS